MLEHDEGLFCDSCGVSSCKNCQRTLDRKLKCKYVTWNIDKPFPHLWANVGVFEDNAQSPDLEANKKYFCSWCQRTIRSTESVIQSNVECCDFQKYKNIIIPPPNVKLDKNKVISIEPVSDDSWEPLIVFANKNSGSNQSGEVLSIFRGLLNPIQVIDVSRTSPESVVKWLPSRCRVLVAGGDGTIAWVLNALHTASHIKAKVGIMPMGTGNDLSRALGWGASCASVLDAHATIASLLDAVEQPIDRWKVSIVPKRRLGRLRRERVLFAYNYASVGVDAQVALDFHYARSQFLYKFASRTLNYMAYAVLGAGRVLDAGRCGDLERRVRVWTPAALALPPLQALVALNIPSWGAGVDLWSMGSEEVPAQSICDGKLEVVGISSSFHIARLQCGLAEPYRFTQASTLKIELDGRCAMQVDGEPWMQDPATIHIEHAGQSLLLKPRERHD
ncbi:diacylglycerol kinase epsilon isoform X2 [Leptidea sinapis]|nr:diacylglycerol kinase epsilon isoform X2 [Leptidea sinapis]